MWTVRIFSKNGTFIDANVFKTKEEALAWAKEEQKKNPGSIYRIYKGR